MKMTEFLQYYDPVADPENFGGGDFKNFVSSLKWRLIFWPKSEIQTFFPPKIRWSPKKKKKKKVSTQMEEDPKDLNPNVD